MAVLQHPLLWKPPVLSHESSHCPGCQIQQMPQVVGAHLKMERPFTSRASSCGSGLTSSRSTLVSSVSCRAAAQEADDGNSSSSDSGNGGGFEVDKALERVLQNDSVLQNVESANLLDGLAEKALQDEESKALLKDFSTAAERVARAKQELESFDKRERDLADIVSKMINQAVDEETEITSLVRLAPLDSLSSNFFKFGGVFLADGALRDAKKYCGVIPRVMFYTAPTTFTDLGAWRDV